MDTLLGLVMASFCFLGLDYLLVTNVARLKLYAMEFVQMTKEYFLEAGVSYEMCSAFR
jgi:hypothetical protein